MSIPTTTATLAGTEAGGRTVTLAADSYLRAGYDASIGKIFSSGIGQKIGVFMAIVAIILLIALIVALLLKARGSQSEFTQRTAGSGTAIGAIVAVIVLLTAFQILMPIFASFADTFVTAAKPILQNLFG